METGQDATRLHVGGSEHLGLDVQPEGEPSPAPWFLHLCANFSWKGFIQIFFYGFRNFLIQVCHLFSLKNN